MENRKLERWAQELLDTGKRNNMINFKTTKASTVEVVFPEVEALFEKCLNGSLFEIYDPQISEEDESDLPPSEEQEANDEIMKKSDYIALYSSKLHKAGQILVYAKTPDPITAIKNIDKKTRDFLEETGVNVAYMAFGFVHWKEKENSGQVNKAPLLLVPVRLKNESSITPYYIQLTEDDIVVNPTFSYLLNAQYGITLPDYEEDESLTSYISKVKSLVSKLQWEVTAECMLGIFSFLKINMYHDLMNNQEKILQNDNVRLLLGESGENSEGKTLENSEPVKNEVMDLHTVVDADSSQMEAIEMAKSGKSFVLQGPPGTGKSQTITNIIAECLHDDKKVLFVSEKLAALRVVYDKLKKAGLEEFCLELHSHKSSKKEVITELCRTLKADRSAVSSKAEAELQAKARLQEQLDTYAEELHKPLLVIKESLYQLYEDYYACRKVPELEFSLKEIEKKDENYLNEAVDLLKQYEEYIPTVGDDYRKNEWLGYMSDPGSFESADRLKNRFQMIIDGLEELLALSKDCEKDYSIESDTLSRTQRLAALFNIFAGTAFLRPEVLRKERSETACDIVKILEELGGKMITARKQLDDLFEEDIYKIDGKDYYNKLIKIYGGFFSRLFNADYKKMITDIRMASKTGKKPGYGTARDQMRSLMEYQELTDKFILERAKLSGILKTDGLNADTDWKQLETELGAVRKCIDEGIGFGNIKDMTEETFEGSKEAFGLLAGKLSAPLKKIIPETQELQKSFDTEYVLFETMSFTDLLSKLQRCMGSIERRENWLRFSALLRSLKEKDLLDLVDHTLEKGMEQNQVAEIYKKLFYRQWIDHVIREKPVFADFTRISQDKAVREFAEKDRLQFEISKAQIKSELSSKRPSLDLVAGGSEVALLLREGEKKRKQKGIRKLLEEAGNLVQVLKPCFLMSPLSVSTFLSENGITFDTVVFDEASQIFPQDAIGAIYRAKQLIVVGDSKQMPPSNFFNSAVEIDDTDEETGDVADFESILDLCSASLPQKRLKWHYRSRYEQLIAFSNKNFYDNTLVTFPSSTIDHEGIGVDYYHVDGLFDRKSHTNRKEAEFIVELVYKNIEKYPERSLGVVAFSVAQQGLIERLISKRRQEDPSKETFFKQDDTVKEPFFVKNLETVQGDERDTIIFSVAYGMDAEGKLLHNFGPLNRVGGERRLNVAVTRAKKNVQLVSSMHAADIDLNRTSAEGARLLREYLDYAENGNIEQESAVSSNSFEKNDSEFEMEVCDFLRENGFSVDVKVGCSGFKIDLGVRRPESSDYIMAIECDGEAYHSSKNARDRDRLRKEVLERMGWKFYRIWSTDWYRNTSVEKELLLKALNEAGDSEESAVKAEEPVVFEKTVEPEHVELPEYKELNIEELRGRCKTSRSLIKSVAEAEAPIAEEYLLKRICGIYGREKVTSAVKEQFEADMKNCEKSGIIRKNGFLYLAEQNDYKLRVPGDKREIRYIAPEELAAGLSEILKQNYSVEKDSLYRTLADQLGFTRVGDVIEEKFDEALRLLEGAVVDGDNVRLK
ncbi:MAG: DUF4011 domain-containing protein [Lachnospiraceae bacterium]|nr:DUF4011 domain-containing protein [Lachnospiraceae bacterium]